MKIKYTWKFLKSRNLHLCVFLLFTPFYLFSQNKIEGLLYDKSGLPIINASIIAEDTLGNDILGFALSDENGYFLIEKIHRFPIKIKITSLNYKPLEQVILTDKEVLKFILEQAVIDLEEITVKAPVIQQHGDTISYNLKQFAGKNDRVLADLLQKIPGIEVEKNGSLRYQGVPINKFYVEGKDLLEGGYSQITNSLPVSAVSGLQVFEHHQPVKMLRKEVPSPNAAINIELAGNTERAGRVELGMGLTGPLWNAKTTLMHFNKKYQSLFSYKSNNNAEDIISESLSFENGLESLDLPPATGATLGVGKVNEPLFDPERYLFNKTHTLSSNVLVSMKEDWELRINSDLILDRSSYNGRESTILHLPDSTFQLSRENEYLQNKRGLKLAATLIKNAAKSYLINKTSFKINRDQVTSDLKINADRFDQVLNSPGGYFVNKFKNIGSIGRLPVSITSKLTYADDNQKYIVQPWYGVFPDNEQRSPEKISQTSFRKMWTSENDVAVRTRFAGGSFSPFIGLNYSRENIKTQTILTQNNTEGNFLKYENNLVYTKYVPSVGGAFDLNRERLKMSIRLPLNSYYISTNDRFPEETKSVSKITFEPGLWATYIINQRFSNTLSSYKRVTYPDARNLLGAYVFTGLNFTAQDAGIGRSTIYSISDQIDYKNILASIFISLRVSVKSFYSNVTIANKVEENGLMTSTQLDKNSVGGSKSVGVDVSKYFVDSKLKLSLNTSFSHHFTEMIINGQNTMITQNTWSVLPKANYIGLKWAILEFRGLFLNTSNGYDNKIQMLSTRVLPGFIIGKSHFLGMESENYMNIINRSKSGNNLFNVKYRYTFSKTKADLEVEMANIFHQPVFHENLTNPYGYSITETVLRPRQVMATVKFNIK